MGFFVSFNNGELIDEMSVRGPKDEQIYLLSVFSPSRCLCDGGKTSLFLLLRFGAVLVKELK